MIRKRLLSGVEYPEDAGKGIDTEAEFGIVALNAPLHDGEETKAPYSNDWGDEDGEDTLIPDVLAMQAYDVEFELGCKGGPGTAYDAYMRFRDFLTGRDGHGARLTVYDRRTGVGKSGCWLKERKDVEFLYDENEDVVTWTMVLRVTEPMSAVVLK